MIVASLDTNVLVYAAARGGDDRKHVAAAKLVRDLAESGRGLLPLQVLSEFYAVAVRKGTVAPAAAEAFVVLLGEMFPVQEALLADVQDAIRVHREHGISFWDGMLWSVTRRAGARILLSEDFQDGRDLEGVRFVDPFAERNAGILTDLI
jgi:predicted nucleic acid-binding protein